MSNKEKVRKIVYFAILLSIETIFSFTILGQIPVGPIVMTLSMIPIIVTSLTLGLIYGSIMGFIGGLYSFIYFTFINPGITSFVFTPFVSIGSYTGNVWSLVICFIPRILTGLFPALFYNSLTKVNPKLDKLWLVLASLIGSLTNTILVLGGIWLFFGREYSDAVGGAIHILIGTTILTNGLPEAILSALACPLVVIGINSIRKTKRVD